MVLPFRIKLKKDCTKNASAHLCSMSEVVKTSSKMTLLYPKIAVMWQVQVKLPTKYFGSFLIHANSRKTYYLLLYPSTFQDHFEVARALPQLHKNCETFYRSNSRWPDASFGTEKSLASGMVL